MAKPQSLSRIRRHQRAERNQLRLAQVLISLFRVIFRIQGLFISPKRREKLRQLWQRLQAIQSDKNAILEKIKRGGPREGIDALVAMQERYASPEDRKWLSEPMQSIWQESDALQAIRKESDGDNSVAAQGYRDYIALYPASVMARKYLGRALHTLGDKEGSLQEYRTALQMAGPGSVHGASARLDIGKILQEQGQTNAAVAEFQGIIDEAIPKTKPIACMAFFYLGNTFHEAGQRQQA